MFAAMRVRQWNKNGLVLVALIFAGLLTDLRSVERALMGFFAFSLTASAVYIFNDIGDVQNDRLHPKKRHRPIASGNLSIPMAIVTLLLCLAGAATLIASLAWLPRSVHIDPYAAFGGGNLLTGVVLILYAGINVAYTLWLKHLVLWDVFTIAAGFVLRAYAGALVIPVPISPWFYLCTLFLALFLALGKRRTEFTSLDGKERSYRAILQQYNLPLLDQLMSIVVTCSLITYSLYTFLGSRGVSMMATIPFVTFGLFRYLYLIYVKSEGDQPDEVFWRDRQILCAVVGCVLVAIVVLYGLPWYQHHQ